VDPTRCRFFPKSSTELSSLSYLGYPKVTTNFVQTLLGFSDPILLYDRSCPDFRVGIVAGYGYSSSTSVIIQSTLILSASN
jgi:hypothetical protein